MPPSEVTVIFLTVAIKADDVQDAKIAAAAQAKAEETRNKANAAAVQAAAVKAGAEAKEKARAEGKEVDDVNMNDRKNKGGRAEDDDDGPKAAKLQRVNTPPAGLERMFNAGGGECLVLAIMQALNSKIQKAKDKLTQVDVRTAIIGFIRKAGNLAH